MQKRAPDANPVDRLGRATTGIVLFAKTPQAASLLFAKWNTPKIQKIYQALAQNLAEHDVYEILTPIGLVPHPFIGSVWAASPDGKASKSIGEGAMTHHEHHNLGGKGECRPTSSDPNPSGIRWPSVGRRSAVRPNRPAA